MKITLQKSYTILRPLSSIVLLIVFPALLFLGCATRHYRVNNEAVPVDALEHYKKENAEIPAKIQVVNFVVNSVDANYPHADKEVFRRNNAVAIPNLIQASLGKREVFSEVTRVVAANPSTADYLVYGTYDFSDKLNSGLFSHGITVHGVLHVRMVRAKDNVAILDKDFVEDRSDEAKNNQAVNVNYLQPSFIEPITAEIKQIIAQDLAASKGTSH